jgi:hypothetical protein
MNLIEHCAKLEDPRIDRKKLHALIDLVVLSVCAIVSGAAGWQGIVEFGHEKLEWLRRFVPLKNGVPSHDCIAYVFARIPPEDFRSCFWHGLRELEIRAIRFADSRTDKKRTANTSLPTQQPAHQASDQSLPVAWDCEGKGYAGRLEARPAGPVAAAPGHGAGRPAKAGGLPSCP